MSECYFAVRFGEVKCIISVRDNLKKCAEKHHFGLGFIFFGRPTAITIKAGKGEM